jgi:hypothetical protein
MLTILNIINYLLGKPLTIYLLVLITVIIYYYIITSFWDTLSENKGWLGSIILLMIIDITTIIIIFTDYTSSKAGIANAIELEKSDKSVKTKKTKSDKKDKNKLPDNNLSSTKNYEIKQESPNNKENKSVISLYKPDAEVSLKTF